MAYIYEHIRTQGFEPMHFEEHFARLNALARKLLLAPLAIEREELQRRVAECLRNAGCSPRTTNAVYVQCYAGGDVKVEAVEMLYNTFSLRALRPNGYICRLSGEILLENSSAKEAVLELNYATHSVTEQGVPIWVDELGEVLAINGSPAIAVFENEICFSSAGAGVEFELAYNAAQKMKRNVSKRALRAEELPAVKELLYIDYRGITALEGFEYHRYMDITAERIAKEVATIEQE
jgi:hypothetical protein